MLGTIRAIRLFNRKTHTLIKGCALICVLLVSSFGTALAGTDLLSDVEGVGRAPVGGPKAAMMLDKVMENLPVGPGR